MSQQCWVLGWAQLREGLGAAQGYQPGLVQGSCSEGQAGKHIILGQQSRANSVCVPPNPLRPLIYSTQMLPKLCWNHTPEILYLLYTSTCFPVSSQKQPPAKSIIVSFSMKEKVFLSLMGSQLLQTRAIPLKPGEMGDLTPPPLLLRHPEDPALSPALLPHRCSILWWGFCCLFLFCLWLFCLVLV